MAKLFTEEELEELRRANVMLYHLDCTIHQLKTSNYSFRVKFEKTILSLNG